MARSTVKVKELITWTLNKDLRLPGIQRRYVWQATRVRDLLDSLYRGYPSGSILVWETSQDVETKELSVDGTGSQTMFNVKKILLDGQQRITSLTAVIEGKPIHVRHRKRPIEILFNLNHPDNYTDMEVIEVEDDDDNDDDNEDDEEYNGSGKLAVIEELNKMTFVVGGTAALKNNPIWVSVSDIFNKTDKEILKPLGINSDDPRWDQYSNKLNAVRKIRDYEYVVETLPSNMSYQEVTQIFVRVNSKGMKLRSHDLALAQISSKWKGFVDLIEGFAKQFGDDDELMIKTGIIVRTMAVFATHQSRFETIGRIPVSTLEESFEKTKKGLRYAIDFLKNNANVGTIDNLSSPFLLVPIAVYGVLHDENLSSEEEKYLMKWFYLAHMHGHYGRGSSEGILDADISVLFKGKSLKDLIEVLRSQIKQFGLSASDIAYKNAASPLFKMLYFVLRHNKAKDWQTGMLLSDEVSGKSHGLHGDHVFPRSLLRKEKYEKREINEIANLAFITGRTNIRKTNKTPAEYFNNEIIPKRGTNDLESQLIPMDKTLWEMKNYKQFLEYRRNAIANIINNFMKQFEVA